MAGFTGLAGRARVLYRALDRALVSLSDLGDQFLHPLDFGLDKMIGTWADMAIRAGHIDMCR
ncbi:MAG TPA: hypothetical protein VLA49_12610 [Anaerolineales bacterium]|nr:hypothetical protein [Anaerolineales bacterium]